MSDSSADRLSVLTSVGHELQAGMIVAALEREGIRARASGVLTSGFRTETPGMVQILVLEHDLRRAQELLRDIESGEPIDWSQVDVGRTVDP